MATRDEPPSKLAHAPAALHGVREVSNCSRACSWTCGNMPHHTTTSISLCFFMSRYAMFLCHVCVFCVFRVTQNAQRCLAALHASAARCRLRTYVLQELLSKM